MIQSVRERCLANIVPSLPFPECKQHRSGNATRCVCECIFLKVIKTLDVDLLKRWVVWSPRPAIVLLPLSLMMLTDNFYLFCGSAANKKNAHLSEGIDRFAMWDRLDQDDEIREHRVDRLFMHISYPALKCTTSALPSGGFDCTFSSFLVVWSRLNDRLPKARTDVLVGGELRVYQWNRTDILT